MDFKWLLKLHASEGEKERFETDVAREKAKREAAAAGACRLDPSLPPLLSLHGASLPLVTRPAACYPLLFSPATMHD